MSAFVVSTNNGPFALHFPSRFCDTVGCNGASSCGGQPKLETVTRKSESASGGELETSYMVYVASKIPVALPLRETRYGVSGEL